MTLRTIAIDDEPIALEKLRQYIEKTPFLSLAGCYCSALDALEAVNAGDIDLIFTDINMPDLNGLEFAKLLANAPMIVFTTAFSEYAVESYRVSAIDYLLKPYSFVDFQKAANRAITLAQRDDVVKTDRLDRKSLFVKVDYKYIRVDFSQITYIKGYGEYLQIYTRDKSTPYTTLSSFASIMQQLPDTFIQVHRSYIVNIERIDRIERSRIIVDEVIDIPIGKTYKDEVERSILMRTVGGK